MARHGLAPHNTADLSALPRAAKLGEIRMEGDLVAPRPSDADAVLGVVAGQKLQATSEQDAAASRPARRGGRSAPGCSAQSLEAVPAGVVLPQSGLAPVESIQRPHKAVDASVERVPIDQVPLECLVVPPLDELSQYSPPIKEELLPGWAIWYASKRRKLANCCRLIPRHATEQRALPVDDLVVRGRTKFSVKV